MAIALVVTQPFAGYERGDRITDPATVQRMLNDHHHRLVKITVPDEAPATPKAEEKK